MMSYVLVIMSYRSEALGLEESIDKTSSVAEHECVLKDWSLALMVFMIFLRS